jgi:sortase B
MQSKIENRMDFADKIVSRTIAVFFAAVLAVCAYVTYDSIKGHNEVRATSADALSLVAGVADENRIVELQKTVNSEIKAWVELDGTDISYPITQAGDNTFYLTHNFRRDYAGNGSIFADFRNNLEQDDYVVVYGHNMNGEQMFGPLKKYADANYFSTHASGKVYTAKGSTEAEVLGYAIVEGDDQGIYGIGSNANGKNDALLQYIKTAASQTGQWHNPSGKHSRLMLLSTCYNHSSKRAVVLLAY